MKEYKIVGLERRGKLLFGVFLGNSGEKCEIYTIEGDKINISEKKIIWRANTSITADNEKTMKQALQSLQEQFIGDVELPILWEFFEEDENILFWDMVEAYFGKTTESNAGNLFTSLIQDKVYFKLTNNQFIKNSEKHVDATLKRMFAEQQRYEKETAFASWFVQYNGGKQEIPEEFLDFLELLRECALKGEEKSSTDAKRIANLVGSKDDELLLVMENKGLIDKNVNELIHRYDIPTSFSKTVMAEVEELLQNPVKLENRKEISDIWSIAIDSEDTEEVDDALSLHQEQDYDVVGVHIADVNAVIAPDSALDKSARRRFATVYFVDERIPLFPMEIVKEHLTLEANSPRAAITGFFYFDKQGILQDIKFERTLFTLQQRATYEETLGELGSHPNFLKLLEIATQLRQKRSENGAIITEFPDSKLELENDVVHFQLKQNNDPGHFVVSEFMILFNNQLAEFLTKHETPAFFRIQDPGKDHTGLDKEDPLYPLKLRWCFSGSSFSTTPGRHSTLGLDAYTQGTSPIRRYSDLVIHRQLIATLEQTPPLSLSEIQEFLPLMEKGERSVKIAESERFYFWFFKFLKSQKNKIYEGWVSRVFENNRMMVFVPELFQEFPFKAEHRADAKEGKRILLKVQGASSRKKRAHFVKIEPRY